MSTLGGVRDVGSTSSWKSGISEPDGGAEGPMWVDGVVRGKEQEGILGQVVAAQAGALWSL